MKRKRTRQEQPAQDDEQPEGLDDLVDHDHAVTMDNAMTVEMANEGFSIESGQISDQDGEPTSDHGEPFTDDFTEIFDNLGREPDDKLDTDEDREDQ